MKPKHWTPSELLEYVCTRPRMFAEDGSFGQIAAFVDGYYAAARALTDQGWAEWAGFRTWLADRAWEATGLARNLAWQAFIRRLYPDDQARLEHLPSLFAENPAWRGEGGEPSALAAKCLA